MVTLGPESNSENATTVGTLVHLIGLFSGFVGTGLVYLFSDDEFTKQNAKNAFNWQIIFVVAFGAFVLVAFFDTFFSALITIIGIISLFTLISHSAYGQLSRRSVEPSGSTPLSLISSEQC